MVGCPHRPRKYALLTFAGAKAKAIRCLETLQAWNGPELRYRVRIRVRVVTGVSQTV